MIWHALNVSLYILTCFGCLFPLIFHVVNTIITLLTCSCSCHLLLKCSPATLCTVYADDEHAVSIYDEHISSRLYNILIYMYVYREI